MVSKYYLLTDLEAVVAVAAARASLEVLGAAQVRPPVRAVVVHHGRHLVRVRVRVRGRGRGRGRLRLRLRLRVRVSSPWGREAAGPRRRA